MHCEIDKNVLQWKNIEKNRERKSCKTWTDSISINIPTFFHRGERMYKNQLLYTLHWCKDYKANDWPLMTLKQFWSIHKLKSPICLTFQNNKKMLIIGLLIANEVRFHLKLTWVNELANSLKPQGLAYYARRQSERHIGAKSFIEPLEVWFYMNGPSKVDDFWT